MLLYQRVAEVIQRESLLEGGESLVVGVSGGPDSLCLLDCLHHLGYQPVVAHLDHGLHAASRGDQAYVAAYAESLGLPFETRRLDVEPASGSLEERLRLLRYQFLVDVAADRSLRTIAVGHTADDQTETVLMHLLRGSGSHGLRGMLPQTTLNGWIGLRRSTGLSLIRPLLEFERRQTQAHCQAIGLEPRQDPSNADLSFFRNRLRHELIPRLKEYNPAIVQVLARTAKVMEGNAELISGLVQAGWDDWVRKAGEGVYAVRRQQLLEAPVALQRALVRELFSRLRPNLRDIGFEAVEGVLECLRGHQRGQRSIVGGLELVPLRDEIVIREPESRVSFPQHPQLLRIEPQILEIPGKWDLADGWRIEADERPTAAQAGDDLIRFDREKLSPELVLRAAQVGDRIHPAGMSGSMKLSDLFINRKVPRPARPYWPVVVDGARVLWVPGLHRSAHAGISASTKRVAAFRLRGPE